VFTGAPKSEPISEEWLASVGFKWHQLERQPARHWVLWLGGRQFLQSYEDLGVEIAPSIKDANWTCWLQSDLARRYHRFIFLRHLQTRRDLTLLVEALSGLPWVPENNLYGAMRTPDEAARIRSEDERLDRLLLRSSERHYEIEKDATRGGALPEHKEIVEGGPF
jgi:hypothetical protein